LRLSRDRRQRPGRDWRKLDGALAVGCAASRQQHLPKIGSAIRSLLCDGSAAAAGLPVAFAGQLGELVTMVVMATQLQEALTQLYERTMRHTGLAAEAQQAHREFSAAHVARTAEVTAAADASSADGDLTPLDWRFREWFLLERQSLVMGTAPIVALELSAEEQPLQASTAGVYAVTVKVGEPARGRDMQDGEAEALELCAPEGALLDGDLLIGRMYRGAEDRWVPSAAVAVYRPGMRVAAAIQTDLGQLGLERRLTQLELEQLLLRQQQAVDAASAAAPTRPVEHLEAELEQLFAEAGDRFEATDISESLHASATTGEVINSLLDELAFETTVDLDRARRLLLELWNAHHQLDDSRVLEPRCGLAATDDEATDPAPAGAASAGDNVQPLVDPSAETLGQRLVRELDAGIAARQDIEELFEKLEALAGIDPAETDQDEGDPMALVEEVMGPTAEVMTGDGSPADAGDFDPLLQEYLWETDQRQTAAAQSLGLFLQLQHNAPLPRTDLESITGQDLMRLLLHVYLAGSPKARAQAVRQALTAVREFFEWLQETQEFNLQTVHAACRDVSLEQFDRLQAAGLALSTGDIEPDARPPALLHVVDIGPAGFGLRGEDSHDWITTSECAAAQLREGDLLLGAVTPTTNAADGAVLSGQVVALPADAESLIG